MSDKLILFIGDWIIIEAQGLTALGTVIVLALLSGGWPFFTAGSRVPNAMPGERSC